MFNILVRILSIKSFARIMCIYNNSQVTFILSPFILCNPMFLSCFTTLTCFFSSCQNYLKAVPYFHMTIAAVHQKIYIHIYDNCTSILSHVIGRGVGCNVKEEPSQPLMAQTQNWISMRPVGFGHEL